MPRQAKSVIENRSILKGVFKVVMEGIRRLVFSSHPHKRLLVLIKIPLPISWDMYLVCMECSSGNKFVSVDGCFLESLTVSGFTVMVFHLLSPMG